MTQNKEAFLDRWSRLKQEPSAEKPAVPEAKAKEEPEPPLQPIEELNADSDFKPFMNPKVDLSTRRAALKKLFTTDAQKNFSAVGHFVHGIVEQIVEQAREPLRIHAHFDFRRRRRELEFHTALANFLADFIGERIHVAREIHRL